MTNPTSNFGWQMPTSTDLVTDLPADFEVFGQAVDTDFVDLLGGTTGQVLSKTSATDLDFTWVTANPGDITGVTAGTGITGGGTSGTVTVTNDMATTITAAGDIVVGTGSGTYDNLPIGTTAQVLTADTTVSPYKVKWDTPAVSTPTMVGCSLSRNSDQTVSNNTSTNVTFNLESFDTNSFHDNATNNSRITIPTGYGGTYEFIMRLGITTNTSGTRYLRLYKNGTLVIQGQFAGFTNNYSYMQTYIVSGISAADYFDMNVLQDSGGDLVVTGSGANYLTSFSCNWLGA
jgi:hypothetical protein